MKVDDHQNNGRDVWHSKDRYRFIAWAGSYWGVTGMQWYHAIVERNSAFGTFHSSWSNTNLHGALFPHHDVVPVSARGYEQYKGRYCHSYGYRGNSVISSNFQTAIDICNSDGNCGGVAKWSDSFRYNLCGKSGFGLGTYTCRNDCITWKRIVF